MATSPTTSAWTARRSRAGADAARDRRIEMLHHPIAIVRAALDQPNTKVSGLRTAQNQQIVDIDHGERREADAGDRRRHEAADARDLDGRQRQHGRRRDRHGVLGLRRRRRGEAAEALHDEDGQVPAVRSGGLEEHASTRGAPDLAAPAAVKPRASPAAARRSSSRPSRSGKGIWWLAGSGNHRSVVFEFDDPPDAVRGAAERGAIEGRDRQGADALSEAADAGDRVPSSFRSFRRAARRGRGRADDRHLQRQRGVLQGPARAQAHDRARRAREEPAAAEARDRGRSR